LERATSRPRQPSIADQRARGVFLAKSDCIVAGIEVAIETFRQLESGVEVTVSKADGAWVRSGEEVAAVKGLARTLLTGERTALNFLQRLSGIATLTRRFVNASHGGITSSIRARPRRRCGRSRNTR
jgi:nicotinate-nucleotide pyrophosphorylase (carboxylating)